MKTIRSLSAFVVFLAACAPAFATTYYIDPNYTGTTQNGTITYPYNSWSKVTFAEGNSYFQKCGTTAAISFKLVPKSNSVIGAYGDGNRPIIYSTVGSSTKAIDLGSISGTTVQDIEIEAPDALCCISMSGTSSNLTIDNCVVHNSTWGIRLTSSWTGATITNTEIYDTLDDGVFAQNITDLEISYCYIHDVNQNFVIEGPDETVSGGDCIQLSYCYDFYIHHNLLDHSATGNKFTIIAQGGSATGIIEYNHMIGQMPNGGSAMYLDTVTNLVVRSNVIENSSIAFFATSSTPGLLVYNNIINHNGRGIYLSGSYSAEIYNNTFHDTGEAIYRTSGTTSLACKNNIFGTTMEIDRMYWLESKPSSFTSDCNLIYPQKSGFIYYGGTSYSTLSAWKSATSKDSSSIASDPLFTAPGSSDFSLVSGSPAIGAGTVISGVTGDAPIDIGADVATLTSTAISVDGGELLAPCYVATPQTDPSVGELVGFWHMDEASGSIIEDASDYGSFGTISGATWTTGKWGSALSFAKADSDFVLLDNTDGNLFIGPSSFTLAAWIMPTSSQTSNEWRGIIGGPAAMALYGSSRTLAFQKTTLVTATSSGYSVPLNEWTHVAITFDSTATTNNLKYYVNGTLVKTVTFNHNFPGQENLIGVMTYRTNYFDGAIDEVGIWNYVLTPAEVAALIDVAPTVEITAPEDQDEFAAGDDITITADATDSDGSIAKVEFYAGDTKLGEDTASPYSFTWEGVAAGQYSLIAKATDDDGVSTVSAIVSITVIADDPAEVVGRYVFYNNSYFDGNKSAASAADDSAIDSTKSALLPGNKAAFANYTSYSKGINGIMIDVAGLTDATSLSAANFTFKTGNSNTPSSWTAATAPTSVSVRTGEGVDGSDRVTIIWADGAITKTWLQVTVLADATTGLDADDVFYFGNAIGETGNSTSSALVDATDIVGVRDHTRNFLNRATADYAYDINKDSFVDATDMVLVRDNTSNFLNVLKLITVP